VISGKVWSFGDDINTDLLQPSDAIFLPVAEQKLRCMSANRPGWAEEVQPGELLVAGRNFGTGSSRPAARLLKDLGIACLLADSINGLFFRNCVNYAFPALEVEGVSEAFEEGDVAEVDFDNATVTNSRSGEQLQGLLWPPELASVLKAGGLIPLLVAEGLVEGE